MFALSEEHINLISVFKIIAVLSFEGDMINISGYQLLLIQKRR